MTEEINDPNLWRCTFKKMTSLGSRHIIFISKVILALAALAALYFLISYVIVPGVFIPVFAVLASIPWYYYGLGAIPAGYFVYSLLWCMARDLTEDDWKSDDSTTSEILIVMGSLVSFFIFLFYGIIATNGVSVVIGMVSFLIAGLGAIADIHDLRISYAYGFIGAYTHYKRRTKP